MVASKMETLPFFRQMGEHDFTIGFLAIGAPKIRKNQEICGAENLGLRHLTGLRKIWSNERIGSNNPQKWFIWTICIDCIDP